MDNFLIVFTLSSLNSNKNNIFVPADAHRCAILLPYSCSCFGIVYWWEIYILTFWNILTSKMFKVTICHSFIFQNNLFSVFVLVTNNQHFFWRAKTVLMHIFSYFIEKISMLKHWLPGNEKKADEARGY